MGRGQSVCACVLCGPAFFMAANDTQGSPEPRAATDPKAAQRAGSALSVKNAATKGAKPKKALVRSRERAVEPVRPERLAALEAVAEAAAMKAKLRQLANRSGVVTFPVTPPPARTFLSALLARETRARLWVVCENPKNQETFFNEIENWHPHSLVIPELTRSVVEGSVPDPDILAERQTVLRHLTDHPKPPEHGELLVVTRETWDDVVPAPGSWLKHELAISVGEEIELEDLAERLQGAGYTHAPQVSERGQFAIRGGIFDIFSHQMAQPVRVELFDVEVESIREFDVHTQISTDSHKSCRIALNDPEDSEQVPLTDYLQPQDIVLCLECETDEMHARITAGPAENTGKGRRKQKSAPFYEFEAAVISAEDVVLAEAKRQMFFERITQWEDERWQILLFCNNRGELDRLQEMLVDSAVNLDRVQFQIGTLSRGFTFPDAKLAVMVDAEIFGRYQRTVSRRMTQRPTRTIASRTDIDFSDLEDGDYVVHEDHGIARYRGIEHRKFGDAPAQEVIVLEFADDSRFYAPLDQAHEISRYVGMTKKLPKLSELADQKWSRTKQKAQKSIMLYAQKLMEIQASREVGDGYAFGPDTKWQHEFEDAFIYNETPDQVKAIADTKRDMEGERPMDRLICGDVGFGKTEVAIRAAFKAVMEGKQVAVLVPTTVLAQQHFDTFRERMADYPILIDTLSRFRSRKEQTEILKRLKAGEIDIVIGTHRLISKDVVFKDLGLVVIDEEQRFGVKHKEKFKELFSLVDVLTLSATPIPRTLYMALMGARDMSVIETPPPNRVPVETTVTPYDERVVRDAIKRELSRQGQVFFLHNRVYDIEQVTNRLKHLIPGLNVAIGHGQMDESALEDIMHAFVEGKFDVLVCTTIIESGLDIPNANTIIIDRADRFGLADLYQLRGRVGRSNHKAYAYLMLPRDLLTTGDAGRRLSAIREYGSLGAGFKIAMRDLEIRGAGNILGTAQSGQIAAVGFDLYCKMLRQAVDKVRGKLVRAPVETQVRIDFTATNEATWRDDPDRVPCFIPADYMPDPPLRIQAYRALAELSNQKTLKALRREWRDRYGQLPDAAENLLTVTAIRLAATHRNIQAVEIKDSKLQLQRAGDYILANGKFPRLTDPLKDQLKEALDLIQSL